MEKKISTRSRWLSLLLGGIAFVMLLRRSFIYATVALGAGYLLYQGLTGRSLLDLTQGESNDFLSTRHAALVGEHPISAPATPSPQAEPELNGDAYDQIDEQSFQSFPASDPPATRIG